MDHDQLKKSLRKRLKAERNALSPVEVTQKSNEIFERWRNRFSLKQTAWLHLFLSMKHRNEVDTQPFIDYIWTKHSRIRLVVPILPEGSVTLQHGHLSPDTKIEISSWGIPEPVMPIPLVQPMMLDMVLIPMLGFDLDGNRIGYGAGHYDRFLSLTRPQCLKIGICF
ncbi:MAG: 5-formyltetrahydrofolate cyclo-ligase [Bacteroidota bacterium]